MVCLFMSGRRGCFVGRFWKEPGIGEVLTLGSFGLFELVEVEIEPSKFLAI